MNGTWKDDGVCAQIDSDLWFPEKGHNAAIAKRICRTCPVQRECLAAGRYEAHGIWGGLTYHERLRYYSALEAA
jgi:WhiB family redox-sensing transcriptional regulator